MRNFILLLLELKVSRLLGGVEVRASDSTVLIERSRVRLPSGELPGNLGQLSLPSLRGR